MTSPILVTGGTGTLGRLVVPQLREAGRPVRVLSRTARKPADGIDYYAADLMKGEGIEPAVDGVETVLHLAGGFKGDDQVAANLVRALSRTQVRHLVYISVIGVDTMPLGWFTTQLRAEQAIADSGIDCTILRAAQFHYLVLDVVKKMVKMPVVPLPGGLRFQPVDERDVATRLAELTLGAPAGRVPDLAGPAVYPIGDLVRGYLQAVGKRRPMLPVRMPGKAGRAYRAGHNLALNGAEIGKRTWEDYLAERLR